MLPGFSTWALGGLRKKKGQDVQPEEEKVQSPPPVDPVIEQYLKNQALNIMSQVRHVKTMVLIAVNQNELNPATRKFIYEEALAICALAEVRDDQIPRS